MAIPRRRFWPQLELRTAGALLGLADTMRRLVFQMWCQGLIDLRETRAGFRFASVLRRLSWRLIRRNLGQMRGER